MRAALAILAAVLLLATPASLRADTWPDDPAWSTEWGPVVTHTVDLWAKGTGSPGVVIAVVDTGVAAIPDLEDALVPGVDFVGGGVSQGGADELGYHGTWVASIIAARGNNHRDAAGYCWRCSIMPVRVSDGESPVDAELVAKGIVWAVDHGARVVNVSLAGGGASAAEERAVAYAVAHGVLVVGSAGNSGDESPHYPGAYPPALSVTGTDEHDRLYSWSTRGQWVTLAGPGCATVVDPNVGAAYGCGSSFAPAAVSGIAGLLLSFDPSLSADKVAAALRSSAHAVEGIGGGRVDAAAAFAALDLPDPTNVPPPAPADVPPAAAAAPPPPTPSPALEATVLRGSLSGTRGFTLATGSGRLVARLTVRPPVRCQLRLQLGSSVAAAVTSRGAATIAGAADAGTVRAVIACPRGRVVGYTLAVERPAPD